MALYVESSAILAWIFGEAAGEHARKVINSVRPVVSSTLSVLEVERAVRRALSVGSISEADAVNLQSLFRSVSRGWEFMEMTPEIQRRAAESFPVEPLRSLDALHLATVLSFLELYSDLAVLSFDARILDNLRALGVPIPADV
ncbi:MAG: type II toxin-antitoxin system VapC family toxin [Spirochaetia bacterium]